MPAASEAAQYAGILVALVASVYGIQQMILHRDGYQFQRGIAVAMALWMALMWMLDLADLITPTWLTLARVPAVCGLVVVSVFHACDR